MKNRFLLSVCLIFIFSLFASLISCNKQSKASGEQSGQKLLVFTKTEGFRHASIPDGVKAVQKLAAKKKWGTYHTEDASVFTPDSLQAYEAVIFLSTTGDILNEDQQAAFEQYIQQGGGFVGIHAATDTEYDWPWYGKMVGAYFESHPKIQEARLEVMDQSHPSTKSLPKEWVRTDEWYNFKDINPDINVLINLDESSYEGGKNGENHPAAWYHEYDGGRIFYTAGGHTSESYSSKLFLDHIWGGVAYVTNTADE